MYKAATKLTRALLIFKPLKRIFDKIEATISRSWRWIKTHIAKSLGALAAILVILIIISYIFPPLGMFLTATLGPMLGITVSAEGLFTVAWLGAYGVGLTATQFGALVLATAAAGYGIGMVIDKDATQSGFKSTVTGAASAVGNVVSSVGGAVIKGVGGSNLGRWFLIAAGGYLAYQVVSSDS